ncbi:MAG: hypothetical protein LBU15_01400 [Rickettsiales bacterium]|jgi:hypothetical protein|nr:hypothetical protein [Rickettsiales bacterium]
MGVEVLMTILENFRNTLAILNLGLFLGLVYTKKKGFSRRREIATVEISLRGVQREIDGLDLEISYLTNPERLRSICADLDGPPKHIVGRDEIRVLDELIPFYRMQQEKTASSFGLE